MNDTTARLFGTFSGIGFALKMKEKTPVQIARLTFDVELDETGLPQLTSIIPWQKQQIHMAIARRQPSLFDGKEAAKPQGQLPLTPSPDSPPPAPPSLELLKTTWRETLVNGPDGISRGIFIRGDDQVFMCWDCQVCLEMEPADVLEEEIRKHICEEDKDPEEISVNRIEVESLEMYVNIVCNDGVKRRFQYSIEHYRRRPSYFTDQKQGPGFTCDECNEEMMVSEDSPLLPFELMAAHVCPPVCHKCHAALKHGEAFADVLKFHYPGCEKSKLWDPDVAVATSLPALGKDPYANLVEAAPTAAAAKFLLEDATESFARIEESCNLPRSVGRKDMQAYTGLDALNKKLRAARLKEIKKASKDAWNRAEVLLQDFDTAKAALNNREKMEVEEHRRQWNEERDRQEREKAAEILAGPAQPYDEMLRLALFQQPGSEKKWEKIRVRGANEQELRVLFRAALFNKAGTLNLPGKTSLSWDGGYYPSLWHGPKVGAATIEGEAAIDAVRRVLQIPLPPPGSKEEDDENEVADEACRICGCTERAGCSPEELDGEDSCWWVEDDLCSNPKCLRAAWYTEEAIQKAWKEAGRELPVEAAGAGKESSKP